MARQRGIYSFGDFTIPLPHSKPSRSRFRQVAGSNFTLIITPRSLFPQGGSGRLRKMNEKL